MMRVLSLKAEPPTNGLDLFEPAEDQVEGQTDDTDHHHRRDDEVVAVAGIAGVNDEVAKAGINSEHLGRDDHQPGDAEGDAKANEIGRASCREV